MNARVWTIVLNWNGLADTTACLDSLRKVSVPDGVTWTRLVVDNGSTDGSLDALPERFPEVRLLPTGRNLRWAGGNNAGLELALAEGADGVLLLNNDTVVEPACLARLLEAVAANPSGGVFGPTILSMDGTHVWSAGGDVWPALGWSAHRGLGQAYRAPSPADPLAVPCGYVTGAALYVTRACLDRVGLLDTAFYFYGEDADYCLRARAKGFGCLYVPRAVLRHRVSGASGATSPFKAYHRTRAALLLASRHAQGAARVTWPLAFPFLLFAQASAWAVRGGGVAAYRATGRAVLDHLGHRDPAASAFAAREEAA